MLKDQYDKITHEIIGCAILARIVCNLKDYSLRNIKFNLANLENLNKILVQITYNLNKIKVQTYMAYI